MFKSSEFIKNTYKTGEVAKILNVIPQTVMNYDRNNLLIVKRTESNRRVIFRDDLLQFLRVKGLLIEDDKEEKIDIVYARVSSNEQKTKGDLDRQALYIIETIHNLQNPYIIKEVGSGLNDKRTGLHKVIDMVLDGKVRNIYVTYKDRLTRFGFNYLDSICIKNNVKIIVVKDEEGEKNVEEELVEDMMSLIASFSGKLYGLRSGKNKGVKDNGKI